LWGGENLLRGVWARKGVEECLFISDATVGGKRGKEKEGGVGEASKKKGWREQKRRGKKKRYLVSVKRSQKKENDMVASKIGKGSGTEKRLQSKTDVMRP